MGKVFADDNFNYFLSLSKIRKLDAWLLENYSIDCFVDVEKFYGSRDNGVSSRELKRVNNLIKQYQKYFDSEAVDRKGKVALKLTDIYASEAWSGWWHSTRRAWLIDSMSICSAITAKASKNKPIFNIVDIGCNVGVLANYLVEHYAVNVTGIDISEVAVNQANRRKKSDKVDFRQVSIDDFEYGSEVDLVVAVDFVQPTETNFSSLMSKVGDLVKSNGNLVVIGNFVDVGGIDEFFRSIGFACISAQLTGGYQQGHAQDFEVDWSTKVAMHFKKNTRLASVRLPITGLMTDFAAYANSGEFAPRELNRSYFLPRMAKNLVNLK